MSRDHFPVLSMHKPFDTTLKQLLDAFAPDWIGWLAPRLDLPDKVSVSPCNAELTVLQLSADRVFQLNPPASGLLHLEPQSSHDLELPQRLHEYNVLLHRQATQVYSVALLLRREANSPSFTGLLQRSYPNGQQYESFQYFVVRVWELEAEALMAGGVGTLPLALLTDDAEPHLGELVDRIDNRLRSDGTPEDIRQLVLTSGYLLLGLRYDDEKIQNAFVRARGMKESTTYQAILREGREEGALRSKQEDVLEVLRERFAVIPPALEQRIRSVTDLTKLHQVLLAAIRVSTLDDLQL